MTVMIKNYLNKKHIKVYPFYISFSLKNEMPYIIKDNAITNLSITQHNIKSIFPELFSTLKQDDNNKYYFSAFIEEINNLSFETYKNGNFNGKNWENIVDVNLLTNQFSLYSHQKAKWVFVLNDDINLDSKNVFFPDLEIDNNDRFIIENKDILSDELDKKVIKCRSSLEISRTFKNAQFNFELNEIPFFERINSNNKTNFQISFDEGSLVDKIKMKVYNGNYFRDQDIYFDNTNKNVKYFKWTVHDVKDNLQINATWFDYDIALPLFDALNYVSGNEYIDKIFGDYNSPSFTNQQKDFVILIHNIILISYLFKTQFRDIPRLQPSPTNPNAQGQIDPKYTLGTPYTFKTRPLNIINIANQNPTQISDYLYKQFISQYPNPDPNNIKAFNRIISAISDYVFSPRSISQGQVPFNQVFLPWYFIALDSITIKQNVNNFEYNSDTSYWKIISKYFDIDNNFKLFNTNLSKQLIIDNGSKNYLEQLPDSLEINDTTTQPISIIPTNKNDLSYFSLIMLNNDHDWKKLFLGAKSDKITEKILIFDLPEMNVSNDNHIFHLDQDIINFCKNAYGKNVKIDILYRGDRIDRWEPQPQIKLKNATPNPTFDYDQNNPIGFVGSMGSGLTKLNNDIVKILLFTNLNNWLNATTIPQILNFQHSLDYIKINNYNIKIKTFEILIDPAIPSSVSMDMYDGTIDYSILKTKYINVKVKLTDIEPTPEGVTNNKNTIFTYYEWIELLKKTYSPDKLNNVKLKIGYDKSLTKKLLENEFPFELSINSIFNKEIIISYFDSSGIPQNKTFKFIYPMLNILNTKNSILLL